MGASAGSMLSSFKVRDLIPGFKWMQVQAPRSSSFGLNGSRADELLASTSTPWFCFDQLLVKPVSERYNLEHSYTPGRHVATKFTHLP
jgi:hypothetical protein